MSEEFLKFTNPKLQIYNEILIVGSSNSLLNNYGEVIDSYKYICRFNRAPVQGYEIHVGSKTNLRVLNNHVFENIKVGSEYSSQPKKFVKQLNNTNILRIGPGKFSKKFVLKFKLKNNKVFNFDYKEMEALKKEVNFLSDKNMSVGAVMISLCIVSNIKVNIIGFDIQQKQITHYWENRPKTMSSGHDFSIEKKWLKSLVDKKIIKLLN